MHDTGDSEAIVRPTEEEKRATLELVLRSQTFSRSEQLRSFLTFICEMEIAGRASEVTEYLIGVQALGRRQDFSPAEDSSVRTRAHELRHRLHKFYSQEHPEARLRIELPKGFYTPRYVHPESARLEAADAPEAQAAAARTIAQGAAMRAWVGGFLLGALVAAGVGFVLMARLPRATVDSSIREAWAPLVSKDEEILICVATPLHLLVSPRSVNAQSTSMGVASPGVPKYPTPDEVYSFFRRFRPLPSGATLEMQPVQKAVSMGDVQALARVVSTLQALGVRFRILPESNFPLSAMHKSSVVLFGTPWYSRAASGLLEGTPWATALDPEGNVSRGPQSGTEPSPEQGVRREYREVFGLITVLPSDKHADDGHTIVIFSGLTSVGSHGAATFFTAAESMRKLLNRLKAEGHGSLPRSYQVLVRCRGSEDTQLVFYDYEAHQVLAR